MTRLYSAFAVALLSLGVLSVHAAPKPDPSQKVTLPNSNPAQANVTQPEQPSGYWLASIERRGQAVYNANPTAYKVFRNVKDFGARGDGVTDDTAAINAAIRDGGRCGQGCDSSTTTPALVYFPPGTYMVSTPIQQMYYTQLVGDAVSLPVIKATPNFVGMAVIDADPYDDKGNNWYTNQNNFFRQIRNFVIDLRALPISTGAGIHWQVAQATSLQNIVFEMVRDQSEANKQQGIFMDNGAGGWMSDLVFRGGGIGAFFGNQQFTTRNLTFTECRTAIIMNWNWAWTFKSLFIEKSRIGIDMANLDDKGNLQTGSILILDSSISTTDAAIVTGWSQTSTPRSANTLILDNVDFTGSPKAVANRAGDVILAGNTKVAAWAQGRQYDSKTNQGQNLQGPIQPVRKPASMLVGDRIFERSKPQYENLPVSAFLSAKANGCKGDGQTDDTAAIQALLNKAGPDDIVYFDHGAYIISDTVNVPTNIKITGEIWPLLLAKGAAFQDEANPKPLFRVGQPGDRGNVEMSDLVITTAGPQPGVILTEWNIAGETQGSVAMWDVHYRIAGFAGTELQSNKCLKNPGAWLPPNLECRAAFMLFHVTQQASVYLENTWFWVADHELDLPDHAQINIYNGRGVLIESQKGPVWMYGTSSEHHQLYNYQIANARNVFMALIQTETPYFQGNPQATVPFKSNPKYYDPTFANCNPAGGTCAKAWGLRIVNSSNVLLYGGGLYSFFENYSQVCLKTEDCQEHMVSLEGSRNVHLFGLSTKASASMVTVDNTPFVPQADNRNVFCSTLALFHVGGAKKRPTIAAA